tara:strand:+ start:1019 stop:1417 length:399 start_codon:yes stop_codon:yes gene_type:complete
MSKLIKNASDIRFKQLEERYGIPCNDIIKDHIKQTFEKSSDIKKNMDAKEIADLFQWDLFPSAWEQELNKSRIKDAMLETELIELKRENGEECPGCGKNTLKVIATKQMRSADEDDTKARLCAWCGYNDRQS